jgi:SPP1 family predicted phage head-tail adaptor
MRKETYRSGELDQRVTFRREQQTSDGMGGQSKTWGDVATVWAHVRPMSGREREHADRLNAEANYLIVIRYRTDIDETDVAVWKGRQFNLRFNKDRARSRFLEIEAERGVVV